MQGGLSGEAVGIVHGAFAVPYPQLVAGHVGHQGRVVVWRKSPLSWLQLSVKIRFASGPLSVRM